VVTGGLVRSIKGDGLTLRGDAEGEPTARGAAPDRSGSIRSKAEQTAAGDESSVHNSAHLIADRFRGTGDGKGRNLVTTSATYNADSGQRGNSMAWAEEQIVKWLEGFPKGSEFTLEVSLEWGGLNDRAFIDKTVADALEKGQDLTAEQVEAEVAAYLAAHPGTKLQRVLGMTYVATLDGESRKWEIGPDKWLAR
jgi:hypothetical protein